MNEARADLGFGRRNVSNGALALLGGASLVALCHGAALAETPPAHDGARVQEVIVTATRSGAQSLQSVSMAVSAINPQQLDRLGQAGITDLTRFTPSLSITESAPGQNKFDMRGLTTGGYAQSDTSDRSLVAVYLDEAPISLQGQTPDLKVFDLERVEVLRGPQGTLYGAGSMAGTIRFITAKPTTHSTFGTVEVQGYGTAHGKGSYSVRGTINLPLISDKLALRAAIYNAEDGGFIDNIGVYNHQAANYNQTTQARLALRWTPTPRLTIDGAFTYEKSHAFGTNNGFSGLAPYQIATRGPEGTRDDFNNYAFNVNYDLGFADLISSTSYTWRRIGYQLSIEPTIGYFFQDYTGLTPVPNGYPLYVAPTSYNPAVTNLIPAENYQITNKVHNFMQEVRLVSKDDGPIKWTVGAFYEHQRRNLYQDIPTPGFDKTSYENYFFGSFNTPDGLYNSQTVDGAFHPNDIFSGLQNVVEHQIALFTDDTWHVTPKLDLTAGVRYFHFHEDYYLFESGVYGVVNHVPLTQNAQQSSDGFNPRFNISYKANPDLLLYAEVAKGFRYGGANQPVPIGDSGIAGQCKSNLASYGYTSAPLTFGPDKLWSYSVGEKGRFANGRVTLNADAYWIDWSDVQTRLLLNCSYFFTDNKGKIRSRGIEAETTIRLSRDFSLSGNASYNDARANGNIPTVGAFNGDLAPYFPRWIASITGYFDHQFEHGSLHAQVGYQYRGDEHTTFNPLATTIQNGQLVATGPSATFAVIPAYSNIDAAIAYDWDRYEVGIFGSNLSNDTRITDIVRATYYAVYQPGDRVTYARPRTIGARLRVKF